MRDDIRHGYAPGRHFGSERERQAYVERFEAAKIAARKLGRRYVVAPGYGFTTHDGRHLAPGDEVVPTRDFAFSENHDRERCTITTRPVWQQLEAAISSGRIIDSSGYQPGPEAA